MALLEAEQIISGALTRQQTVFGVEQDALRAGRIVDDPSAELAPSEQRTTSARTELVPKSTPRVNMSYVLGSLR